MSDNPKRDALGNVLVIGSIYGYTVNSNGITDIRVGKLTKVNKSRVTIETHTFERICYDRNADKGPERTTDNKKASVKAHNLFPIDENDLTV